MPQVSRHTITERKHYQRVEEVNYLMPLICAMLLWEILDSAEITCGTREGLG